MTLNYTVRALYGTILLPLYIVFNVMKRDLLLSWTCVANFVFIACVLYKSRYSLHCRGCCGGFNSARAYILDWGFLITVLSLSLYVAHSPLLPIASLSLSSVAGRRYRRLPFSLSLLLCRGFVGVVGRGSSLSPVVG